MVDQVVKFPEYHDHEDQYKEQKKKTGKRKIEMKAISNKTSKQVTFSKRRNGLFKKAAELCFLCGAEVSVIAFSAAGKLFSFGHPTPDAVIRRYINFSAHEGADYSNNNNNNNNNNVNNDINSISNFGKLSEEYKEVLSNVDLEKKGNEVTSSSSNGSSPRGNIINDGNCGFWWDNVPINDLGIVELERLKVALEGLRAEVCSKIDSIHHCSISTSLFHPIIESGSSNYENGFGQGYGDYGLINNNNDHIRASKSVHPSLLMPIDPIHHCSNSTSLFHPIIESGSSNYENGFAQGYGHYGMINNNNDYVRASESESVHPSLLLPMNSLFGHGSEDFSNF